MLRAGIIRIGLALALVLAVLTMAVAQTEMSEANGQPKYDVWERVATRAEGVISNGRASTEGFEALRTQLTEWRATFESRQTANSARIKTLRTQIAALGEAPAEGETEPESVSARRAELQQLLAKAQTPSLRAEEAYIRANGLVREVDTIIRDRQTDRNLRLDPSPLNPVNWPDASRGFFGVFERVGKELEESYSSPIRLQAVKDNLPLIILMLVVGFVLVLRSTAWIERGVSRLRNSSFESSAGIRVGAFLTSVFGVLLPFLGATTLFVSIIVSGFMGPIGELLVEDALSWLMLVFAALWLGRQVFPKAYPPRPVLTLTPAHLKEGRFYATVLGALIAFDIMGTNLAQDALISRGWSDAVVPVLRFPILVVTGVFLFRIGQLLSWSKRDALAANPPEEISVEDQDADLDELPTSTVIVTFLSRVCMIIGVIGPILAAIGYVTAGGFLVMSTGLTLGLIGLVAVIQRFLRDLIALFIGDDATGSALLPVLAGIGVVALSLPFLALIWGAREADLLEVWSYVTTGFSIGETRISPMDFLAFVVIFALGYGVTKLLQGTLRTQVLPKTKLDTGGRNAIVAGTGYVGIFLAALIAITGAGLDLSSLAIVAGALSVGIGFGLQTIVSNFVSGIILLIERPISEGDWIEVGTTMGVVKDISVRATRIETFDRTDVIVPNADLIANSVTNWTKGNMTGRLILPVGVAYGTDTMRVDALLREIAEAHPMVIVNPPPGILFVNFGADALEFEVRVILRDVNYMMVVKSELNHEIARRFAEEGFEIPFAQRDLWLRNPEVLAGSNQEPST